MFKWPRVPSAQADPTELADYVELTAWQSASMSITATLQDLGRPEDNDYSDGVTVEEEAEEPLDAACLEIIQRQEFCRTGYPFVLDQRGYTLRVRQDDLDDKSVIYKYLLLATRLNMNANRHYSGYDGTLLLEELAAEVAREYLGARAESLVFGTAVESATFPDKVDDLCSKIGEGGGFKKPNNTPLKEKDGKLDIVVWKNFADGAAGKLIGFGQCKTGTNYKDQLAQLQPDAFCKKWLRNQPAFTPIRMFFIAEALPRINWYNAVSDAGLLFDRCRIIDFCDSVTPETLGKIKAWTEAAAKDNDLPGL